MFDHHTRAFMSHTHHLQGHAAATPLHTSMNSNGLHVRPSVLFKLNRCKLNAWSGFVVAQGEEVPGAVTYDMSLYHAPLPLNITTCCCHDIFPWALTMIYYHEIHWYVMCKLPTFQNCFLLCTSGELVRATPTSGDQTRWVLPSKLRHFMRNTSW